MKVRIVLEYEINSKSEDGQIYVEGAYEPLSVISGNGLSYAIFHKEGEEGDDNLIKVFMSALKDSGVDLSKVHVVEGIA